MNEQNKKRILCNVAAVFNGLNFYVQSLDFSTCNSMSEQFFINFIIYNSFIFIIFYYFSFFKSRTQTNFKLDFFFYCNRATLNPSSIFYSTKFTSTSRLQTSSYGLWVTHFSIPSCKWLELKYIKNNK